ncbi:hypothetical protein ATI61_101823 [Archangium gephyra]|uniref:Lipoprotein n=1 Tax=Archangium gephyra TaxID=48 RepID=A0AAC8TFF7_9BACT|nr:hypothetical protein [Archangium gephyra]AKJ04082.1 Hypothetical protein AA314_05708 [Archangium gephyra]REG37836.1 hypothetical protein ATI61_101823 [Archangium gephyra]
MPLLRWSRSLFAVAVVLVGCKPNTSAAAMADADAATQAPSKTPAPVPTPASGAALSYLKPVGPEKCEWVRQALPSGAPTTLFTFDGACGQSVLAWSPNGKEGLVLHRPEAEGAQPRLWRVDFTTKSGKRLALVGLPVLATRGPDKPFIEQVGFDAQGRPVALVSNIYANRKLEKDKSGKRFILFENQRYPVEKSVSSPGLALAYRLEGSDWKRFETKVSTYEPETAPGINALDAAKALAPVPAPLPEGTPGQEASESAAKMLDAALPQQDKASKWMALPTPGGTLLYRGAVDYSDESFYPAAPARWEQDGKLVELAGLKAKDGDRLGFQLQDGLLIIFVLGEDSRSVHVYDTRTKKNLASVQGVESAAFWPEPPKP